MSSEILTGAYQELLDDLKNRIRNARVRAALSVNRELVPLYWQIGQAILERQAQGGWSLAVLLAQLENRLHERTGKAITNLSRILPAPRSDGAGV
jgi:predicted nuclease of restriction endonuclease-like (RecB) superfamily